MKLSEMTVAQLFHKFPNGFALLIGNQLGYVVAFGPTENLRVDHNFKGQFIAVEMANLTQEGIEDK